MPDFVELAKARDRLVGLFKKVGPLTMLEIKAIDPELYTVARRNIGHLIKHEIVIVVSPRNRSRREVYGLKGQTRCDPDYEERTYSEIISLLPRVLAESDEPLTSDTVAIEINEEPRRVDGALRSLARRGIIDSAEIDGVVRYSREPEKEPRTLVDRILEAISEDPGSTVEDLVEETGEKESDVASLLLSMRRVDLLRMTGTGYFLTGEGRLTLETRLQGRGAQRV